VEETELVCHSRTSQTELLHYTVPFPTYWRLWP